MNTFFNKKDIDKAKIDNKELDGKEVVLRCLEVDGASLLCGVDENGHIYVLRMDEI